MEIETQEYGKAWKPKAREDIFIKRKILEILQGSFVGIFFLGLPTYYIFPFYLIRFGEGRYPPLQNLHPKP